MRKINKLINELDETERGWDNLFRQIKLKCSEVRLSNKDAHLPENRRRNRYRNVSPYDHSRVMISGENDYINASLVKVPKISRRYILTQGPLEDTTGQFWQMVWEQNSRAVIMLNKVIENRMEKCFQYFPVDENQTMEFDEEGYKIEIVKVEVCSVFTLREIKLSQLANETSRSIFHFHYTTWPDFGVPDSPKEFLQFLTSVRERGVLEDDVGPAILHCSAGIGRSGTFALVDACLVMAEKHIPFNATDVLIAMRNDRMGLIQTYQQLRFSYLAIAEGSVTYGDDDEDEEENESTVESVRESSSSESETSYEEDNLEEDPSVLDNGDGKEHGRKRPFEEPDTEEDEQVAKKEKSTSEDSVDKLVENNNKPPQLTQRKKTDKQISIEKKVDQMREKMKEQEKKKGQSSWVPYIVTGISVTVALCLVVKYYWQ